MDHHINPHKTALSVGAFFGFVHIVWSLFVALGWAQPIVNFALWAHMASVPLVIKPFDLATSVTLIVVVSIIGYIVGSIFARIWNRVHGDA